MDSAGIHQKQHLHRVFPGVFVADLQRARVVAGIPDGAVHVQHLLIAVRLDGELPQQPEGHLELAGVQGVVLPEIPILALPCHRHGGTVAALAADADAAGVPAAVAPGGAALGAHPVVAAVVLLGLLLEPLFQTPEQLLQRLLRHPQVPQAAHRLPQVLLGVLQPLQHLLRQLALPGNVLEKLQKHLVEPVVLRLAFHQYRPAQLVESGEAGAVEPLLHALEQRQPLIEGHVQPPLAQEVKK